MGLSVVFLRGVNVGTAKRVAMHDLRAVLEALGCENVTTILNSGNAVYESRRALKPSQVQRRIAEATGVSARATVLDAMTFRDVLASDPYTPHDPSRSFTCILGDAEARKLVKRLAAEDWGDEQLAVGSEAAYLWCPNGAAKSKLWAVATKLDSITTRNRRTMERIAAALERD